MRVRCRVTSRGWAPAIAAALVAVSPLGAQSPEVEREAREIFSTVMSPFCPGRVLANCPSAQAAALRDEIRTKLAAGVTREEIVDELYAEYGDEILGTPRAEGFGLLAWLVPGLFFVAGATFLIWWMRSTRGRRASEVAPTARELDPESRRRLDSELSEL